MKFIHSKRYSLSVSFCTVATQTPGNIGNIAYTKAKAISEVKDEAARKEVLENAISNSLSLSQIRELIKELKPVRQQSELKTCFDATYKQAKQSKELWQDPKKKKKLESLLSQLEKLIRR